MKAKEADSYVALLDKLEGFNSLGMDIQVANAKLLLNWLLHKYPAYSYLMDIMEVFAGGEYIEFEFDILPEISASILVNEKEYFLAIYDPLGNPTEFYFEINDQGFIEYKPV